MSMDAELEVIEEDERVILPVYIAVDHSYSMSPEQNNAIDAANTLIPTIIRTCIKNPLADEKARFSIVGFNDQARVVSPLARGTNLVEHTFTASRGTNFSNLFRLLKSQFEADYASLEADGYRAYRPAVFLITDGEPMDDPSAAFAELTDETFKYRPNISVFGLGAKVSTEVVEKFRTRKGLALLTTSDAAAAEALGGFIEVLMQSIVSSTGNAAANPTDDPDGFEWDLDAIEDNDDIFYMDTES